MLWSNRIIVIINQWKGASNYYVFQKSMKNSSEMKCISLSYTWTTNFLTCILIDCVYIMFCEYAFMITVILYARHWKMNKRYQYSFLNYILLMCVVTLHCAILISREWLMRCKNLHSKKTWRFRPKWSINVITGYNYVITTKTNFPQLFWRTVFFCNDTFYYQKLYFLDIQKYYL